jgi:hypothetical protein
VSQDHPADGDGDGDEDAGEAPVPTKKATKVSVPTRTGKPRAFKLKKARGRYPKGIEKFALLVTLAVFAAGALRLGFEDFRYAETLPDKWGSAMWLIAGATSAAALANLLLELESWLALSFIGVTLSLILALQVISADLNTPLRDWWVIGVGTAAIVTAVVWLYLLWRYVRQRHLSRFGTVATAILGAVGALVTLATTWYSTEYLPRASLPKVELTTELAEVGRTGDIVHLSAKITVHNQGTLTVQSVGSLMSLMAYPPGSELTAATPENIAKSIDFDLPPSGEYRLNTLNYGHRQLLYSDDFISSFGVLQPDATVVYQRTIDVDKKTYSRVRLNVTASFFNSRYVDLSETCAKKPVLPILSDNRDWYQTVSAPHARPVRRPDPVDGNVPQLTTLCIDRHIKPRNVTDELVGDRPMLRTMYVLQSPCPYRPSAKPSESGAAPKDIDPDKTCPIEVPYYFTLWTSQDSGPTQYAYRRFDAIYPNITLPRSTEYVVTDPAKATDATDATETGKK